MGTGVSVADLAENTPLPSESPEAGQHLQRLESEGYAALGRFTLRVESPPNSCCGIFSSDCSSCGSTRRNECDCVSWRDEMVRVGNGKGGLVWVKRANAAAYKQKIYG